MNTKIVFAEISNTSDFKNNDLLRLLSTERQERIKRFKFDIDRKLSLYSELLVRYQACKELNISNKSIVFTKNKNGKPFILGHPDFQFNISHTRNAIAVAFSNKKIGVDIEPIKSFDSEIANRFFASSEQEYIASHDNPDYAFYEIWTKKEAYIKYLGTGLSTPLNSFNVLDSKLKSTMNTFLMKRYIISIFCNEHTSFKSIIKTITENKLYLLFLKIV